MTTPPGNRAQLTQAALVAINRSGAKRSIRFQFNPETLRRTVEPNLVGGAPGLRAQVTRYAGAPVETITFDCQFSAADGLAAGDATTVQSGVGPSLAALALIAYPPSDSVTAAQQELDSGSIEVVPAVADRLLFVWGPQRVVPCMLTSFSVTEQLYDANLSPVLATVSMALRAVSWSDVDATTPTFGDFLVYQKGLERLAASAYSAPPPGVST